jgi:ATP-dependent Zn protease
MNGMKQKTPLKKKQEKLNKKFLAEAIKLAMKQPRLTFYSPLSAAVFNYRKSLLPRYSISDEIAKIIETEVRRRWPELSKIAERLLKQRRR